MTLRDASFDPEDFRDDPLDQFRLWMADAIRAGAREPNAMTLATTGPGGRPDARMVLLKDVEERGVTFYTNLASVKAEHLAATPQVALVFWWYETWRQVRVRGRVESVDEAAAAAYFATRPRDSQIAAWASSQSRVRASREALEEQVRRMEERFGTGEVPKPPDWGGYRVIAEEVEFWQGRTGRLHDRLLYLRRGDSWTRSRLDP